MNPDHIQPRLFAILLGCQPKGRTVEQHDYFFGIAHSLKELVSDIYRFWPEGGKSLHIDAWREVNSVDGHEIKVLRRNEQSPKQQHLFFINLGGYATGRFEEMHHTHLTIQSDISEAIRVVKKLSFFKESSIRNVRGANAHIDEKYGLDVDEVYNVEDILPLSHKMEYEISFTARPELPEDEIHLGYLKLDKL